MTDTVRSVEGGAVMRTFARWIAAGVAAFVLASCGGGGDNNADTSAATTPPPATQTAQAQLAAGVRVLSPAETASLVEQSPNRLRFSAPLDFRPGEVVLGEDVAFKVVSSASGSDGTVVQIEEPSLEDLFDSVRIKGRYTAKSSDVRAMASAKGIRQEAITVPLNLADSITLGQTTFTDTIRGSIVADADYEFDRSRGGLQSVLLSMDANLELTSSAQLIRTAAVSDRKQIAAVRIAIPLTLVDRFLRVVGVRLASVYVPVYIGASLDAAFEVGAQVKVFASGPVTFTYTRAAGPAVSNQLIGRIESSLLAPQTPAGLQPHSVSRLQLGIGAGMRPALAFLNNVALAGADISINGVSDATLLAPIPGVDPTYCLSLTPSVRARVFGFVKVVGSPERTTDANERILAEGAATYSGSCRTPTIVTLTASDPLLAIYGRPVSISVEVRAATSALATVGPSGDVEISLGGRTCRATLARQSQSSSIGSCHLTPLTTGMPVQASLSYGGDPLYAPNAGTGAVNVAKASVVMVVATSPNPSRPGEAVEVAASLAAASGGEGEPTGTLSISSGVGEGCLANIQPGGRATCSTTFLTVGSRQISATYSGDANFEPMSAAGTHEVAIAPGRVALDMVGSLVRCVRFNRTDTRGQTYQQQTCDAQVRMTAACTSPTPCVVESAALHRIQTYTGTGPDSACAPSRSETNGPINGFSNIGPTPTGIVLQQGGLYTNNTTDPRLCQQRSGSMELTFTLKLVGEPPVVLSRTFDWIVPL